ncbi:unnamed protein product [Prunus armeniaca]
MVLWWKPHCSSKGQPLNPLCNYFPRLPAHSSILQPLEPFHSHMLLHSHQTVWLELLKLSLPQDPVTTIALQLQASVAGAAPLRYPTTRVQQQPYQAVPNFLHNPTATSTPSQS